ncbi:N-acetylmuramoyl-L-alanine amidase [Cohaesibacter sp. ES.047]|uniref:N-acetylmuramoyl-L-alanine amidase n=1 Tax=Cohaesibacter sp. ES.047 TaxID=1798205 RepID=UPI001561ACD7|nr:N-acetylmuramoyl-L-alanine amidase [Cohaesibacter sp. ES.047]
MISILADVSARLRCASGRALLTLLVCLAAVSLFGVDGARADDQSGSDPVVVEAVRTTGTKELSRFVIDVSQPVDFTIFALDEPYRLVIDLPGMDFEVEHGMGQVERALVKNFRFGSFSGSRSRIVLDLTDPVRIIKAQTFPPVDDIPAKILIELEAVEQDVFVKETMKDVMHVDVDGTIDDKRLAVAAASSAVDEAPPEDPRPLVVIDPGHGGIDRGATSRSGLKESELVLTFAKALKKRLEKDGHVRVAMTREKDVFISLSKRVAIARELKADLFVSIHADTVRQSYVRGATVYTLSDKASDAVAARLARQENRSDLLAGLEIEKDDDVVADILIDLTRRETSNHSALYSRTLVGALKSSIRLSKTPERSAGFKVLKAPDIPSVLVELGYLSNSKDQSALASKAWQEKAVESISKSMRTFFLRRSTQSSGLIAPDAG